MFFYSIPSVRRFFNNIFCRGSNIAAPRGFAARRPKICVRVQLRFVLERNMSDIIKEKTTAAVTPALAAESEPVTA